MRARTLPELLALSGMTETNLRQRRLRRLIALGFGRSEAYNVLRFLDLDAVGMLMTDELGERLGKARRKLAAELVRVHGDVWAEAVACAEHEQDVRLFCIIETTDAAGHAAHVATHTPASKSLHEMVSVADQLAAEGFGPPRGVVCVSISGIIERVRENGRKAGLDMSLAFMPPPGEKLAEILKPFVEVKQAAIAQVQAQDPRGENARRQRQELARRAGLKARAVIEADLLQ